MPKLNSPKRKIWITRQNFDLPKLPAIRYSTFLLLFIYKLGLFCQLLTQFILLSGLLYRLKIIINKFTHARVHHTCMSATLINFIPMTLQEKKEVTCTGSILITILICMVGIE